MQWIGLQCGSDNHHERNNVIHFYFPSCIYGIHILSYILYKTLVILNKFYSYVFSYVLLSSLRQGRFFFVLNTTCETSAKRHVVIYCRTISQTVAKTFNILSSLDVFFLLFCRYTP
jgi:hypothetical protein